MQYAVIIIILAVLLGLAVYFLMKKSLTSSLNLRLQLDPDQVEKGDKVKIRVFLKPSQTIKVESITGSIFCRRYEEFKNSWTDKTEIPGLATGTTIARIEFAFGQDLEIEGGKETKFVGSVPLPEEGLVTEIRGVIQVHWFVTVRVKIRNQPTAEVVEELIVLPPSISDGDGVLEESADPYDPFYDFSEAAKQSDLIVKKSEESQQEEDIKTIQIIKGAEAKIETKAERKIPEVPALQKREEMEPTISLQSMKDDKTIPRLKEKELVQETPNVERTEELVKPESARSKYKVEYKAPFDPTKYQTPTDVVTPDDYIKKLTGETAATEELKKPEEIPPPTEERPEKYKVQYRTPFDPTKYQKPVEGSLVDEYIKIMTGGGDETSSSLDKTADLRGRPKPPGEVEDIYRQRHFVSKDDKKPIKVVDESKIPEQYRARHKIPGSGKEQKIRDESEIPEVYRGGKIKPPSDLIKEDEKKEKGS